MNVIPFEVTKDEPSVKNALHRQTQGWLLQFKGDAYDDRNEDQSGAGGELYQLLGRSVGTIFESDRRGLAGEWKLR